MRLIPKETEYCVTNFCRDRRLKLMNDNFVCVWLYLLHDEDSFHSIALFDMSNIKEHFRFLEFDDYSIKRYTQRSIFIRPCILKFVLV